MDPGTVAGDTGHWWYIAIAFLITIGGIMIVNPAEAKSVIILPLAESNPDANLVRTLLAINRAREGSARPCPIVGCVSETKNLAAARLAGGPHAYLIDANDIAARLIVQTCRQSGLSVSTPTCSTSAGTRCT
jgi:hypothetical protein